MAFSNCITHVMTLDDNMAVIVHDKACNYNIIVTLYDGSNQCPHLCDDKDSNHYFVVTLYDNKGSNYCIAATSNDDKGFNHYIPMTLWIKAKHL